MRLTDEQIRDTVAAMRLSEAERERLLTLALANDPGARLVVYSRWRVDIEDRQRGLCR